MNRNKNANKGKKPYRKGNGRDRRDKDRDKEEVAEGEVVTNPKSRNHYLWYYFDEKIADQVSQMSFQQLADMPFDDPITNTSYRVPSIMVCYLNPSPGVQLTTQYTSSNIQKSAINLAGFRLFQKIAAFTGRTQTYGPQDISTMELFMGQVISEFEWIRRAFGVAFASSMRNRAYPKRVLEAMGIDANDMFINFANYRTQFNALVTRANQIPIPLEVAYFDKCAKLFEGYFTDTDSPMSQILIPSMATTWDLDETSYSGGTVLTTTDWNYDKNGTNLGVQNLSVYLLHLSNHIDQLMNSSTFNVVYTDLLNLATKINMTFWKFDYLMDGYLVLPEFNPKYLIQFHNMSVVPMPRLITALDSVNGITPYNDVYPNPSANALYYNPGLTAADSNPSHPFPALNFTAIVDSPVPEMDVETRVNITRYVSVGANTPVTITSGGTSYVVYVDAALPDHYVTQYKLFSCDGTSWSNPTVGYSYYVMTSTWADMISQMSQIDWAPLFREIEKPAGSNQFKFTGRILGDLNFYTLVDWTFIRKLHDFVGLALYDFRVQTKGSK